MTSPIFDEIRKDRSYTPQRSFSWYSNKVAQLGANNYQPGDAKLFSENRNFIKTQVTPGSLFFYRYDPKYKATLPYYDKFPLTFIIGMTGTHFTGINFHYLPYNVRFVLFDKLLKHQTTWPHDDMKRIKADWALLSSASKFPEVGPAVKQYIISHVMSKFIRIPIEDMKTALLLPVEKFVGNTKQLVFRDSIKSIRKKRT